MATPHRINYLPIIWFHSPIFFGHLKICYLAAGVLMLHLNHKSKTIMENSINKKQSNNQLGVGVIIVIIGTVLLLGNLGIFMPFWIVKWYTILLSVGLYVGYRKNYQGNAWLVLTIVGGLFTLKHALLYCLDWNGGFNGLLIIALGLFLIFKPNNNKQFNTTGGKEPVDFSKVNH